MKIQVAIPCVFKYMIAVFSLVLAISVHAQEITDQTLINEFIAALPEGVTLEDASSEDLALAYQTVTAARGEGVTFQLTRAVSNAPGARPGLIRSAFISANPLQAAQIAAGSTAAQGQGSGVANGGQNFAGTPSGGAFTIPDPDNPGQSKVLTVANAAEYTQVVQTQINSLPPGTFDKVRFTASPN